MALRDLFKRKQPEVIVKKEPTIHTKASRRAPYVDVTGPGQARATPRRYDRLAAEGYRDNPIGYAAIAKVSQAAANVPLTVWQGDRQLERHPLLDLLRRPSPHEESGEDFFEAFFGFYLIAGNSYLVGVGPNAGPPRELHLMRPDTAKVVQGRAGVGGYLQQVGGRLQTFSPEDVLHFKTFNPINDWYGLSPMEAAGLGVDIFNEGSRWNLSTIQKGGRPSGAFVYEPKQDGAQGTLTQDQFDRIKNELEEEVQGSENAGKPLLLEGGLKWQQMSLTPSDMDWQEAKNMTAREIALVYGVPPQMVGIPDSQTYSNYQEARQSFWEETVLPMVDRAVKALNGWLVPKFGEDLEIRADIDGLPALEEKRQRKFDRAVQASFLSINEKREMVGYEPVEGGDVILVEAGKLPLNFEGDQPPGGGAGQE